MAIDLSSIPYRGDNVNGGWKIPDRGRHFHSRNPAKPLDGPICQAIEAEYRTLEVVAAARAAFPDWLRKGFDGRAKK